MKIFKIGLPLLFIAGIICVYCAKRNNTSVIDEAVILKHTVDSTIAKLKEK